MADVFISYARQDRVVAKRLADALAAFGWEAWWDPSLLPGTRFRAEITRQLHGAKCVVVLWSRSSVESDWVIDEAEDAKARGVLVQARIEDVKLPHGFRQIQSGNLIGWGGALDAAPLIELRGGIERLIQLSNRSLAEHNHLAVADGSIGKSVVTRLRSPAISSKVLTGFAVSFVLVATLFGASRLWWSKPPPSQNESSALPCTFRFEPGAAEMGWKGGEGSVRVITSTACEWSVSARSDWVMVSGETRTGSAEVTYVVKANDTPRAREGVLDVQGQPIRISQDAGPLRSRLPDEPSQRQSAPAPARSGGEPTKPAPTPARSSGERTKPPPAKDSPIQPSTVPPPKKTKHVAPLYPEEAQKAGLQGEVKVEIVIGPDGKVKDARVVSPPQKLLDQAALDAAKQWEYEPTVIDGVRSPVISTVNVRFSLIPPIPRRQEEPQTQLQKQEEGEQQRRLDQQQAPERFFASVMGTWTRNNEVGTNESRTRTEEVLNIGNDCSGVLTRTVTTFQRTFAGWREVDSQTSRFSFRCDAAGRVSGDLNTQLSLLSGALVLGDSRFARRK